MSKSVLTIVVIGIVGAILMSFVMKHLVELTAERERSPLAPAVETRLGSKLIGPIQIVRQQEEGAAGALHFAVRGRVLAGADKQKLADAAGREVWFGAMRAGDAPTKVQVVFEDEATGKLSEFDIARPRLGR